MVYRSARATWNVKKRQWSRSTLKDGGAEDEDQDERWWVYTCREVSGPARHDRRAATTTARNYGARRENHGNSARIRPSCNQIIPYCKTRLNYSVTRSNFYLESQGPHVCSSVALLNPSSLDRQSSILALRLDCSSSLLCDCHGAMNERASAIIQFIGIYNILDIQHR